MSPANNLTNSFIGKTGSTKTQELAESHWTTYVSVLTWEHQVF